MLRIIVIIFTPFLVKKKLKNKISVVTPVVTVFIFDEYLQYHMKQKCTGIVHYFVHSFELS